MTPEQTALQFFCGLVENEYISVRPQRARTDYENQITHYTCYGCSGHGQAAWPGWTLEFEHDDNCRYLQAMEVIQALKHKDGQL